MLELANTIQADLRRQACWERLAANLPKRVFSVAGLRFTISREDKDSGSV